MPEKTFSWLIGSPRHQMRLGFADHDQGIHGVEKNRSLEIFNRGVLLNS